MNTFERPVTNLITLKTTFLLQEHNLAQSNPLLERNKIGENQTQTKTGQNLCKLQPLYTQDDWGEGGAT